MSERMEWAVKNEGGVTLVALSGSVDEDADFAALIADLKNHRRLRLDLSRVARINSCGVREWVNFIRALPQTSQLELEKCSPVVVSQVNMISNFAGAANILSVQAPFICESCMHEENVLLEVKKGEKPTLREVKCGECSRPMVFDDIEDSYFAFLT